MSEQKPEWWPRNPYPASAMSIKDDADYAKAIPDPKLRTAVSWYMAHVTWELASDDFWEAVQEWAEVLREVAAEPYADSDPVSLLETLRQRARWALGEARDG